MHQLSNRCAIRGRRPICHSIVNAFAAAMFALAALAFFPAASYGCACGCGVFDVGTSSMLPTQEGGMVFAEFDYMDQNRNWSGTHSAPAANNDDKEIRTQFYSVGGQ